MVLLYGFCAGKKAWEQADAQEHLGAIACACSLSDPSAFGQAGNELAMG